MNLLGLISIISIATIFCISSRDAHCNPEKDDAKGELIFKLYGMTPNLGIARAVLYNDSDKFLSQFGFCASDSSIVNEHGTTIIVIHNLAFGNYSGTFYQDENQNHIMDRNFAGFPTEPYAFSNGIRAKWRIPDFNKASFPFLHSGEIKSIYLNYWMNQ